MIMGCGGYSKISKPDVNGSVYRKITKEEIEVELGDKVRVLDSLPTIVFVYGGPGSKKGRLVSELVEVFDFTFINVEKIMLEKVGSMTWQADEALSDTKSGDGDGDRSRKESVQELKKMLDEDPTSISLSWILREITSQVDKDPQRRYLVDMMPNLKYLIRTATFSKDCSTTMKLFERKYPISFAVYFSLNLGNRSKSQLTDEPDVKEETEEELAGFQTDEVDLTRTKRRQSMFEHSVMSLLEYFQESERLMQVDVSSSNSDAVASRTCEVMSGLSLHHLKLVNTVMVFVFDSKSMDCDVLSDNDIEVIRLEHPNSRLSVATLDEAIHMFVKQLNHKEHKTFVVDLSGTSITKDTQVEMCKPAITFVNEADMEQNFSLPGCKGMYKAVSSLENAICVFPHDTNANLCKKIAVTFNNEFSNPRQKTTSDIV